MTLGSKHRPNQMEKGFINDASKRLELDKVTVYRVTTSWFFWLRSSTECNGPRFCRKIHVELQEHKRRLKVADSSEARVFVEMSSVSIIGEKLKRAMVFLIMTDSPFCHIMERSAMKRPEIC